ncbi:MAG: sodium ion-translocating decarboxylase subunit beta [Candidatus Polarisedimenticolia bacterium]|nr:sodium ion-translocating decarboxylase subunit beta [bacterium]
MDFSALAGELLKGVSALGAGQAAMLAVGLFLIGLAVVKKYEPLLLLPIGAGCLLANLPLSGLVGDEGLLGLLYRLGVRTEVFPLLIFIGVGAMIDFGPLLAAPRLALLGAAGQFGIFGVLILAALLGYPIKEAASIGVIGAIDGPTSIFVAAKLAPQLLAPIAVAAYSYMALVPVIQPPLMRLLTTRRERGIKMEYAPRPVSRRALVAFPIIVTVVIGALVPDAAPLVGTLMLGNLLRESRVVERLAATARNELINISTLFLGLAVGATMTAESFLNARALGVLALGLIAFVVDTCAGLLMGKLMCLLSRGRINPLLGAAGISAFPMAGRLVAQAAQKEDQDNFLLMHALGANTSGQLASVIAGGVLLALASGF